MEEEGKTTGSLPRSLPFRFSSRSLPVVFPSSSCSVSFLFLSSLPFSLAFLRKEGRKREDKWRKGRREDFHGRRLREGDGKTTAESAERSLWIFPKSARQPEQSDHVEGQVAMFKLRIPLSAAVGAGCWWLLGFFA